MEVSCLVGFGFNHLSGPDIPDCTVHGERTGSSSSTDPHPNVPSVGHDVSADIVVGNLDPHGNTIVPPRARGTSESNIDWVYTIVSTGVSRCIRIALTVFTGTGYGVLFVNFYFRNIN